MTSDLESAKAIIKEVALYGEGELKQQALEWLDGQTSPAIGCKMHSHHRGTETSPNGRGDETDYPRNDHGRSRIERNYTKKHECVMGGCSCGSGTERGYRLREDAYDCCKCCTCGQYFEPGEG